MWLWDICSRTPNGRSRSARRRAHPRAGRFGWLAVVAILGQAPAHSLVVQSQEEALQEAFPDASVERHTAFLDDRQMAQVRELAGTDPSSRVVTYYRGVREGTLVATAYFDTHRVRTLSEVLMIVVGVDASVLHVAVLSFLEPRDYLPGERWFEQFRGRRLGEGLSLKRKIRGITGATLSSRAATQAVRRVLALHQILAVATDEAEEVEPTPAEPPEERR
ncbi:MAG: FMN-binding protein [Acidobacteria bacterium]|nr:MAG: FMN-binding protein [Acidobacteriota bacterium]